jgi:hypothetical protein
MADRVTVVPPRDPWPFSTVTVDDLEALGGQLAEASARAGALAADLTVAVGSAQSAQAAASEQRAWAEGMSWLF